MVTHESEEMYLETILVLSGKQDSVRSVDIAKQMGFSKAAISKALARLRERELIKVSDEGHISLTENGLSLAKKVYDKHVQLTEFIMKLGVDRETAEADACKIEHVISDKTFVAMIEAIDKIQ